MKKQIKKLELRRTTIRTLAAAHLGNAHGGLMQMSVQYTICETDSCDPPPYTGWPGCTTVSCYVCQ